MRSLIFNVPNTKFFPSLCSFEFASSFQASTKKAENVSFQIHHDCAVIRQLTIDKNVDYLCMNRE